jgi:hypothetical protein
MHPRGAFAAQRRDQFARNDHVGLADVIPYLREVSARSDGHFVRAGFQRERTS